MSLPTLGAFTSLPAVENLTLVAQPVAEALSGWQRGGEVAVVEIDPGLADTAAFCDAYQVPLAAGANCVVVGGARAGEQRVAACVVRADTRADVNGAVRRRLDVRRASFLAMDQAVADSGMEYGGITPVGIPPTWRLFLDSRCLDIDVAVLGSGLRNSKLLVPGGLLADLPGAEVVPDLAKPPHGA
jgi:prolyl-tRNA editing enzyme YbaK/EbsC (Cys-tRNA(Pro) deacylase)